MAALYLVRQANWSNPRFLTANTGADGRYNWNFANIIKQNYKLFFISCNAQLKNNWSDSHGKIDFAHMTIQSGELNSYKIETTAIAQQCWLRHKQPTCFPESSETNLWRRQKILLTRRGRNENHYQKVPGRSKISVRYEYGDALQYLHSAIKRTSCWRRKRCRSSSNTEKERNMYSTTVAGRDELGEKYEKLHNLGLSIKPMNNGHLRCLIRHKNRHKTLAA